MTEHVEVPVPEEAVEGIPGLKQGRDACDVAYHGHGKSLADAFALGLAAAAPFIAAKAVEEERYHREKDVERASKLLAEARHERDQAIERVRERLVRARDWLRRATDNPRRRHNPANFPNDPILGPAGSGKDCVAEALTEIGAALIEEGDEQSLPPGKTPPEVCPGCGVSRRKGELPFSVVPCPGCPGQSLPEGIVRYTPVVVYKHQPPRYGAAVSMQADPEGGYIDVCATSAIIEQARQEERERLQSAFASALEAAGWSSGEEFPTDEALSILGRVIEDATLDQQQEGSGDAK